MKTVYSRSSRRGRCKHILRLGRSQWFTLAAVASSFLLAGCAATESRYMAKQLPTELQAVRWQAPCTVDLSPSIAARVSPKIDSGDDVEVLVATGLKSSEMSRIKTTVAKDGSVELPILGRISVVGTTSEAARVAVLQACHREGVSQIPLVQVSLQQSRQHRITVSGAVEHPGIYVLPRQSSDLISALAAAGGLSRSAGESIVIQSRGTSPEKNPRGDETLTAHRADGKAEPALLHQGAGASIDRRVVNILSTSANDLAQEDLKDGDVVIVEHRDLPSVVVTGMVQTPGRYVLPLGEEYRVLDAMSSAHGPSYKVIDTVLVCRAVAGRPERAVIEVSLREAARNQNENILLMPGDILTVESNARVLAQDTLSYIAFALLGVAPVVVH